MKAEEHVIRNFTLGNWKSFADPTSFTMVATPERLNGGTLSRVRRSRILPLSVVFGANASGKSAFIEALAALRDAVCDDRDGRDLMKVNPNKRYGSAAPSVFELEFVVSDTSHEPPKDVVYVYELEATRRGVCREVLSLVRSRDEEVLFERTVEGVEFYGALEDDPIALAAAALILPNQTVLGEVGRRGNAPALLRSAYEWFARRLIIVSPRSRFAWSTRNVIEEGEFSRQLTKAISTADSGITGIRFEDINIRKLPFPDSFLDDAANELRNRGDDAVLVVNGPQDTFALELTDDGDSLKAAVLVACHGADSDGEEFTLILGEESDGTRRFLDLIPLFMMLSEPSGTSVCVVDELERSLHPLLTEKMLDAVVSDLDQNARRQLIFSSHEVALLKRSPLRRDEVWLVGKDARGVSHLDRLSTFRDAGVRDGSAIMEMYMAGQLGAVPRI